MKPKNLRHWTIHIRPLSDVSVSRNWYETVSNLYENCSIKQIIFNKYANQSENGDIPQEPENLRFAQHDPIHEVTNPIYITTPLQEPQKCTVMYDLLQTGKPRPQTGCNPEQQQCTTDLPDHSTFQLAIKDSTTTLKNWNPSTVCTT